MARKKNRPLRTLLTLVVLIVLAAATLTFGHISKGAKLTPELALDLQGGTQLILTPLATDESGKAVQVSEQDLQEAIGIIRNRVDASGVSEAEITSMGNSNIVVALPGRPSEETLDLIRSSSQMDFRPVLYTQAASYVPQTTETAQSGASADASPQSAAQAVADAANKAAQSGDTAQSAADAAQSAAAQTPVPNAIPADQAKTQADVNQDGKISDEPTATPENNSDVNWITEKALEDFLVLDCTNPETRTTGSTGAADKPIAACDQDGAAKYILGPVDVAGSHLDSATAGIETNQQGRSTGQWQVSIAFDGEGTKQFAEASQRLFDFQSQTAAKTTSFGLEVDSQTLNRFGVVLDGEVITAPSMNAPITDGKASISGNFTPSSAKALANKLSFGSLPLNFEVQSEQQISATLGSDHLEKGIWAGLIGLLLVVLYLIWQYHSLAILSAGSLVIAGIMTYLTITILSWTMGYRLSLAGVLGIIVSIGLTADSFIVYFERIRDEVRNGKPLAAAVEEGWDRAKRTILISDTVNLTAAAILYFLAVGGVQGFAFTLGLTTVIDLIVVFMFTHPLMELFTKVSYFAEGKKFSGFDPEHLGARSSAIYQGRGKVKVPAGVGAGVGASAGAAGAKALDEAERGKSLAERRFEAAHKEIDEDVAAADDLSPDSPDGASSSESSDSEASPIDESNDEEEGEQR